MKPSHAFLARTRVPDTIPGERKVQRAERIPGSIDLADLERLNAKAREQRSYSVEFKRDHTAWRLDWTLWITGPGHWRVGSNGRGGPGLGGKFRTEAEARDAGRHWIEKGGLHPLPQYALGIIYLTPETGSGRYLPVMGITLWF